MTVQKTRPRTKHSGPRPQAALKLFSTASPGGPIWTLDKWSAASWPNSGTVNTQCRSPIFYSHEVGLLHKGWPISWGTWHPPPVTVLWTLTPFVQLLFRRRSLGPAETIELGASRRRGFPGMLRHCHRACIQNSSLVCGSLVRLG